MEINCVNDLNDRETARFGGVFCSKKLKCVASGLITESKNTADNLYNDCALTVKGVVHLYLAWILR